MCLLQKTGHTSKVVLKRGDESKQGATCNLNELQEHSKNNRWSQERVDEHKRRNETKRRYNARSNKRSKNKTHEHKNETTRYQMHETVANVMSVPSDQTIEGNKNEERMCMKKNERMCMKKNEERIRLDITSQGYHKEEYQKNEGRLCLDILKHHKDITWKDTRKSNREYV